MTKHFLAIAIALAAAVGVGGCATRAQTVGTVGGAAAGGYIGNELGKKYDQNHK